MKLDRNQKIIATVVLLCVLGFFYLKYFGSQGLDFFEYKTSCSAILYNEWLKSIHVNNVACKKSICILPFSIWDTIIPRIPVYTDMGTLSIRSGDVSEMDWWRVSEGETKTVSVTTGCGHPTDEVQVTVKADPWGLGLFTYYDETVPL